MKTLTSESYNVAWFKLADFVARGEKERALSVLRLLMHSVSDEALTYQLEGDILRAFQDGSAIDRYHTAADLYQKLGKFQQAISSHQHAVMFQENEKTLQALLQIYLISQQKSGIIISFSKLAPLLITTHDSDYLINYINSITEKLNLELQIILYAQLAIALLLHDVTYEKTSEIIQKTIDLFQKDLKISNQKSSHLQKFLTDVKSLSDKEYKKAEFYLKECL